MSQALNRTRRNMIAVSVFLILIYSFGWDFPSHLNVLGNEISASPDSLKLIVWGVLVYLVYEYFIQLRTVSGELREKWRAEFVRLHQDKLEQRMKTKYDIEARNRLCELNRQQGYTEVGELQDVTLSARGVNRWSQNIRISSRLPAQMGDDNKTNMEVQEVFAANYFQSGHLALLAWINLLMTDPDFFEYLIPLAFPVIAYLTYQFGPVGFLANETSIPANDGLPVADVPS